MSEEKKWLGYKTCDFCKKDLRMSTGLIDGKTLSGRWAVMCPMCFLSNGEGIGLGRGQMYRNIEGEFIKVMG